MVDVAIVVDAAVVLFEAAAIEVAIVVGAAVVLFEAEVVVGGEVSTGDSSAAVGAAASFSMLTSRQL